MAAAWPAFALAALALCTGADGEAKEAPPPWTRLYVAGASVSAGFGLDPDLPPLSAAPRVSFAHVVEASLRGAHEPVGSAASLWWFVSPGASAERAVGEARAARATALVALDYLFWCAYGPGDEDARLARLERALAPLAGFEGPVLLGDLPDLRAAGVDPLYLPPSAIPTRATLERLDRRLRAWARGRPGVVLVPVAETTRRLVAGEAFEVRGNRYGADARARLFQADNLHTTLAGSALLWVVALDAWLAADPRLAAGSFELDPASLARTALERARLERARGESPSQTPPSRPSKPAGGRGRAPRHSPGRPGRTAACRSGTSARRRCSARTAGRPWAGPCWRSS
jgi:hypothetical protein